jgi:hypothetical protein
VADVRWQDLVPVRLVLRLEPLPARERHDARREAVPLERFRGAERELQLGAGPDQDHLGRLAATRLAQDVAAPPQALARLLGRARERRQLLAGQREADRAGRIVGRTLDREGPRRDRLVRVARPDEPQVRDRPEGGVVLDRLVGRSVLAEPDRVVGP